VSQVNLLPPELHERQAARRRTRLVLVAGAAVLILLALFYVMQTFRLASANNDLAAQQAKNAQLETQVANLNKYAALQTELQQKQQLLDTALQNDFSWSSALLDMSRVIPDQAVLSTFSGSITATSVPSTAVPTVTVGGSPDIVGTISLQGTALDTRTAALLLNQLENVKGWVNAVVNSLTETSAESKAYNFDAGLDLTKDSLTKHGAQP
jgi:Tfp pilus assembly protein PilN